MARSMLSFGTLFERASSTAERRRGLALASPPPIFAATVISRRILVNSLPRRAWEVGASEVPDRVLVSADIPGIVAVASSFSRSAGVPGVIALLAENAAEAGVGGIEADELLAKPFTEQELRLVVRRALAARRAAGAPAPPQPTPNEPKLTSRDIFGDMLAEVESEVA